MPMLPLVPSASSVLHQKTIAVRDPLAPEVQQLIPEMIATMRRAKGIGLAATQVGVGLRLCVTDIDGEIRTFINPKITAHSREKIPFEEGCLSLPGTFLTLDRWERITVRYLDETGVARKERLHGLLAICLQHEVDHLDGFLIVDRHRRQHPT